MIRKRRPRPRKKKKWKEVARGICCAKAKKIIRKGMEEKEIARGGIWNRCWYKTKPQNPNKEFGGASQIYGHTNSRHSQTHYPIHSPIPLGSDEKSKASTILIITLWETASAPLLSHSQPLILSISKGRKQPYPERADTDRSFLSCSSSYPTPILVASVRSLSIIITNRLSKGSRGPRRLPSLRGMGMRDP